LVLAAYFLAPDLFAVNSGKAVETAQMTPQGHAMTAPVDSPSTPTVDEQAADTFDRRLERWQRAQAAEQTLPVPARQTRLDARRARDEDRKRAADNRSNALAAARARVPVTVYFTTWCPACHKARAYLRTEGIRFVEHDIERDPQARSRARLLNPKGSVPTLQIGSQVLVGFSARGIQNAIDRSARMAVEG
jgi:glutaredoxin